jgi:tripartite-type tricarboxylate transporter receptor subunit TctC
MLIARRKSLQIISGVLAMPFVSRTASAQAYPNKPVHWIVPYPPGGPTDILARLLGQWLQERLGQPFIIENKPGASSNIGTELVAKSAPDGYTLLLVAGANAINATLFEKLNFNFIRDLAPVVGIIVHHLFWRLIPPSHSERCLS